MNERFFEKKIKGKIIVYDNQEDVIKFDLNESISDNYSKYRLWKVARYKTDIQITTKCNQFCENCFTGCTQNGSISEMSFPDLKQHIKKRENKKIRIMITGGEPFLHTDIKNILTLPEYFHSIKFVICSNGTAINESHIRLLEEYDWMVILSIHGTPETHNMYTHFDSYPLVTQSLEMLSPSIRLKIYSVINQYSTPTDIDHIINLKENCKSCSIKFQIPRYNKCRYNPKYESSVVDYLKRRYNKEAGLQESSSRTELITVTNERDLTD